MPKERAVSVWPFRALIWWNSVDIAWWRLRFARSRVQFRPGDEKTGRKVSLFCSHPRTVFLEFLSAFYEKMYLQRTQYKQNKREQQQQTSLSLSLSYKMLSYFIFRYARGFYNFSARSRCREREREGERWEKKWAEWNELHTHLQRRCFLRCSLS